MSNSAKYILLAMPLLFVACNKEPVPAVQDAEHYITIGFDAPQTKSLMRPSDLANANTQLKVYAYNGTATPVFDGLTATPPTSAQGAATVQEWVVTKPGLDGSYTPAWEDDKNYTFFSWTQKDASGKTAAGTFGSMTYTPAVSDTPASLAIPSTTLAVDEGTMDFCYSNVVARSTSTSGTAKADYSMVQLQLEHLFAAFSLSAHNYTDKSIKITSVKLKSIHNTKSAVITFSPSDGTNVVYSGTATSDHELVTDASGVTIAAGAAMENIAKGSGSTAKYFMMWPQTESEITATASKMSVTYSIGGGAATTVDLVIPHDDGEGWPAGVCQNMELSFTQKTLLLTVKPSQWNQTEPIYDYAGSATVLEQLSLVSGYINPTGTNNVYFASAEPIILTFKLGTPLNASWMIEKVGDFDAFEIDNITDVTGNGIPGDGEDTKEGVIDGNVAKIAITPKISNPHKDYKIQLSFTVRGNSGTVMDVNGITETSGVQAGTNKTNWYTFYILK